MKIIYSRYTLLAGLAIAFVCFGPSSHPQIASSWTAEVPSLTYGTPPRPSLHHSLFVGIHQQFQADINPKPSSNNLYIMQTKNSEEIIGRWEVVQTTRRVFGIGLEFNRDGSLILFPGLSQRGKYKLEGNHLISQVDGSQETEKEEVEIRGDTLTMKINGLRFDRLTHLKPDSSPIVGKWRVQLLIFDFKSNGSLVTSSPVSGLPFELLDVTYKLNRNQLTISGLHPDTKERVERSLEIRIEGDALVLKDSEGLKLRMRRISQDTPDKSSIIGKWIWDNTESEPQIEQSIVEYTKSGEFAWRTSLRPIKGGYSISRDLLTTTVATVTTISHLRFENGFLLLQPLDGGPEDKFKRIDPVVEDKSR